MRRQRLDEIGACLGHPKIRITLDRTIEPTLEKPIAEMGRNQLIYKVYQETYQSELIYIFIDLFHIVKPNKWRLVRAPNQRVLLGRAGQIA
jgi:hypothetical protein